MLFAIFNVFVRRFVVQKIVDSKFFQAGDLYFHSDHFVCEGCGQELHAIKFGLCHLFVIFVNRFSDCVLRSIRFHNRDNQFYCHDCYVERFVFTCVSCGQKIESGRVILAFGKHYHPQHFCCTECNKVLDGLLSCLVELLISTWVILFSSCCSP